jgi:hypothetical protein
MDISLVTEYPAWLFLLCIIAGLIYSLALYGKDRRFIDLNRKLLVSMAILRFIFITFLAFFLITPLIKIITYTIEKPVIIFAQDNSESIINGKSDSANFKKDYKKKINDLLNQIESKYEISTFSFGDKIKKNLSFDFTDKQTDISSLIDEVQKKYFNRNVGSLIIATDGIYNKGTNPLYSAGEVNFPVYTIALGDTNRIKDLIISQVKNNKLAFLGNKFPIEIQINAYELKGQPSELKILNKNTLLYSKPIIITSDNFSQIISTELEAKENGMQHYQIILTQDNQEIITNNNYKDIVIDVIDMKQKILILANSPHPDIGAIKSVLELNQNYTIEFFTIADFNKSVNEYNLVILHQVPSAALSASQLISQMLKKNVSVLTILGSQSYIPGFNSLSLGLTINKSGGNLEESQAIVNADFNLFEVSDEMKKFLQSAPPLMVPFGAYQANPVAKTFLFQKLKNISTSKPLILISSNENRKSAVICGEGIWRWRINNYMQFENHDLFNEFINKLVNYLAQKVNKDKFNINMNSVFNENEPVLIDAEVYNESYELINHTDISLDIINARNNKFSYVFTKTAKAYTLNAGIMPVGDYSYMAKVKPSNTEYTKTGKFSVIPIHIESDNTIADHQLLYQISYSTKGKMYYPNQLEKLIKDIETDNNIKAVSFPEKKLDDFIQLKWIFFILLGLITAEWVMRKYFGSY